MSWVAIGGAAASAVVGSAMGGDKGHDTQTSSMQAKPFSTQSGLFNTNWNNDKLNLGASDEMLALQQQGLFGANWAMDQSMNNPTMALAGQLGQGFMGQLGSYDPMQVAQQQYGLMSPMMQQGQNQQMLDLEQRQFAQGRLGSTPGDRSMNALYDAHADERQQLMHSSYQEGLMGQQHLAGMGMGMSNLAPQLAGLYTGLSGEYMKTPLSIEQAMLNQANAGGNYAGAQGTQGVAGVNVGQQLGAGLMNSGVQGLTNAFNGMFTQPTSAPDPHRYAGYSAGR